MVVLVLLGDRRAIAQAGKAMGCALGLNLVAFRCYGKDLMTSFYVSFEGQHCIQQGLQTCQIQRYVASFKGYCTPRSWPRSAEHSVTLPIILQYLKDFASDMLRKLVSVPSNNVAPSTFGHLYIAGLSRKNWSISCVIR
jgi:hypothetical protein